MHYVETHSHSLVARALAQFSCCKSGNNADLLHQREGWPTQLACQLLDPCMAAHAATLHSFITLLEECNLPRPCLCRHAFHHMDCWDLDVHVLDGWMAATNMHSACVLPKVRMTTCKVAEWSLKYLTSMVSKSSSWRMKKKSCITDV